MRSRCSFGKKCSCFKVREVTPGPCWGDKAAKRQTSKPKLSHNLSFEHTPHLQGKHSLRRVVPSCHRYIHLLPANPGCIQRGHHPRNPPTPGRSCQALQTLELMQCCSELIKIRYTIIMPIGNIIKYQMRRIIFVYITLWTCINHILTIYGTGHEIYIYISYLYAYGIAATPCGGIEHIDPWRFQFGTTFPIVCFIQVHHKSITAVWEDMYSNMAWKILPASHLPKLVSTLSHSPRTYTFCGDDSNWFTHLFVLKHFEMLEFGNRKRMDFAPSPFLESHT